MYVKAVTIGDEILIAASMSEGRVVVANWPHSEWWSDFRLPENCSGAFDLSIDGRYLVTGYWHTSGVDVWDVRAKSHLHRFGPSQVTGVLFDATGRHVAIRSRKQSCLYAVEGRVVAELKRCGNIRDGASLNARTNEMLIPIDRKATLLRVTFDPVRIETLTLPTKMTIWTAKWSPVEDAYCTADGGGTLACCRAWADSPIWSMKLDRAMSVVAYSGNGELISVSGNDPRRTIVVSASRGTVERVIEGQFDGWCPLRGTKVMTARGEVLDLKDGAVDPAVSKVSWWRALGL